MFSPLSMFFSLSISSHLSDLNISLPALHASISHNLNISPLSQYLSSQFFYLPLNMSSPSQHLSPLKYLFFFSMFSPLNFLLFLKHPSPLNFILSSNVSLSQYIFPLSLDVSNLLLISNLNISPSLHLDGGISFFFLMAKLARWENCHATSQPLLRTNKIGGTRGLISVWSIDRPLIDI